MAALVVEVVVGGNGRGRRGEASKIHTHDRPSLALETVMIQGMENYMLIESLIPLEPCQPEADQHDSHNDLKMNQ